MTAPALVLLANGSTDPKVAEVTHTMRVKMQSWRPEIPMYSAFLDHCPPTGPQVVNQISRTRTEEVVFVPLNLSRAYVNDDQVDELVAKSRAAHPKLRFIAAKPVGPEAALLPLVDRRLRAALSAVHASELDGLVLLTEGADDPRSQSLIARRTRQWSLHHKLPVVTASANDHGADAAAAVHALRTQGRRHIAAGSLFLTADEAYRNQAELALQAGATAVGQPLGAADEVMELALGRYAVASMEMIHFDAEQPTEGDSEKDRHLSVVSA